MIEKCVDDMISETVKTPKSDSKMDDWILDRLETQFTSLSMQGSRHILARIDREVSDRSHYGS